jgi:hypothetical protein
MVGDVTVVRAGDASPPGQPIDASSLFYDLASWLAIPSTCSALLGLCGYGGARGGDGQHARRHLEDAFRRGQLRVVRVPPIATVAERAPQDMPRYLEAEPALPTFIELALVDAKGRPVANERYRITLESREVKEGRLDARGTVRLEGVLGEDFVVQLPDRGISAGVADAAE